MKKPEEKCPKCGMTAIEGKTKENAVIKQCMECGEIVDSVKLLNKEQIMEFLERLEGQEGCNFRTEKVDGEDKTVWECNGGNDQSKSKKILKSMEIPKRERDEFLKKCRQLGGYCDCEIIFNAKDRLKAEWK